MHTPVLLKEVIEGLKIKPGGLYIDATVGEGGHFKEIIKQGGKVLGIDLDPWQVTRLLTNKECLTDNKLVVGNFAEIEEIAKKNHFFPVDGVLFDLGLSMEQINRSGRGFSFKKKDEPLDMRLNSSISLTAADLINSLSEDKLYEIIAKYSEELNSRSIAKAIVFARRLKKIEKVGQLLEIINQVVRNQKLSTYRRVMQALRIAVNQDLINLKRGLSGALKILKKKGRIAIISFHSLEDRIVKKFIMENNLKLIKKIFAAEKSKNYFERSAKLRIIEY
ncbi:MAG: 16S rRNA (cytosine(1402)-N(4))-methyltransferase RsmH [Microgenomates group bacterium]|nr:16S rRNA (cytosine(1402)-N(4))-methyltransferase RsmH [Microgenomates group bacterium]